MKKKPSIITEFINRFKEYDENRKVISYYAMRRNIGILGMALPFVLIVGSVIFYKCNVLQISISQYYHTGMRDFLVGILSFVAMFLFAYRGHSKVDRIAGVIAGTGALGVAFFPPEIIEVAKLCNVECVKSNEWKTIVHLLSALLFFVTLSFISIFLFTRTYRGKGSVMSKEKINRNRIYRISGILILLCLLFIILYREFLMGKYSFIDELKPMFWLETVALFAFGTSWLVKGQVIFKDKVPK
ncbi:MAG: hypothetical protein L3J35_07000 [Bacteroidales bacterium]|nr:hypothetical protein [Bacteroidales bacterium]